MIGISERRWREGAFFVAENAGGRVEDAPVMLAESETMPAQRSR